MSVSPRLRRFPAVVVRRLTLAYTDTNPVRSASLPAVALTLLFAGLGAACATSVDDSAGDSAVPTKDAGKDAKTDGGTGGDSGAVCVGTCGSDLDCQNTCPAVVNNGINCCDMGTNKCFPVADSVCPAPVDQDSGQPPAY